MEVKAPKVRPIAYAAHKDTHIFAHYSAVLCEHYERALRDRGLHDAVTVFRSLDHRRNIHFANEAFEFIKNHSACAVLATDISDYFGTIRHDKLKQAWCGLQGLARLPDDHFAVFKAITEYSTIDRDELCKVLQLDPENPRADGRHRFCSAHEFRTVVRGNGLCIVNRRGVGIPQGSPISAVLSNIYLLEFDTTMYAAVAAQGGLYRRYCDDILFVVPNADVRAQMFSKMQTLLTDLGLVAHPEKTETVDFPKKGELLARSKVLNYLGFTFDGVNKRIRPASVARYYKKMRSGVGRAKAIRRRADKKAGICPPSKLKRRRLHILYSYLGRHNFLSYAFDAARIMKDSGIKSQVKAHWKRLQEEIGDQP